VGECGAGLLQCAGWRDGAAGVGPTSGRVGAQVARLLPAEQSPTVSGLLDGDYVALEVVLDERRARELVPAVRRLGATGVITYTLGLILH
jgi:ATP phosphoribosyltransferase